MKTKLAREVSYNPLKVLAAGLVLTLLAIIFLSWQVYSTNKTQQENHSSVYKFTGLTNELIYLHDKMQTFVSLGITTHDPAWSQKYSETSKKLFNNLKGLSVIAPQIYATKKTEQLIRRFQHLNELDIQVFTKIKEKDYKEAQSIVNTNMYHRVDELIRNGIQRLVSLRLKELRLKELQLGILHLSEEVRLLFQLILEQKNLGIEPEYLNKLHQLTTFLDESFSLANKATTGNFALRQKKANQKLVINEKRMISLVKDGKFEQAQELAVKSSHQQLVQDFTTLATSFNEALDQEATELFNDRQKHLLWTLVFTSTMVFIVIIGWIWNLKTLKRKHDLLMAQHRKLVRSHNELESLNHLLSAQEKPDNEKED